MHRDSTQIDPVRSNLRPLIWMLCGAVLCLTGVFHTASAETQSSEDEERRLENSREAILNGRAFFRQKKYIEGIVAYEQAYRLFPQPDYLYVIAKAYTQVDGRCADAVLAFDRFLDACKDCPKRAEAKAKRAEVLGSCDAAKTAVATWEETPAGDDSATPNPFKNAVVRSSLGVGGAILEDAFARTGVNQEVVAGFPMMARFDAEAGLLFGFEEPNPVLLRAGVLTRDPLFFRGGLQAMLSPAKALGLYTGAGYTIPLRDRWSLVTEINLSPWSFALYVIEARVGVSYRL